VIGGVVLYLGPEYLPLLPAAILYINLVTDGVPALALGIGPPDPDLMKRPPRPPNESIFSKEVILFISGALLLDSPFFLFMFFHELTDIVQARTELFFLFILIELIIALNFRSLRHSLFKLKPHKWLVLAIISQIILTFLILKIPTIKNAFGITLPSLSNIEIILSFGAFLILTMEITKLYLRKKA
jgi:Ca2+-transporting ATPase